MSDYNASRELMDMRDREEGETARLKRDCLNWERVANDNHNRAEALAARLAEAEQLLLDCRLQLEAVLDTGLTHPRGEPLAALLVRIDEAVTADSATDRESAP